MTDEERAFNEYCERYTSLCFAIGLIRSEFSKEEKITRLQKEEPELFKFLFPTQAHVDAFMRFAYFGDGQMTDEERAEIEHFIELHEAGLLMEVKGLGAFASRIEDAVKKGTYKKYDAGVLHELISVAVRALERAKFFLTPEGDFQ